ncbi:MAG: glycosyltransferase family 1 protein [Pseudomonadota bacterium]
MAKVCIDAFNLSLPKGSGIATYGRNLLDALSDLGHSAEVLYGPQGEVSKDNLLSTISLSDITARKTGAGKFTRWWMTRTTHRGRTPTKVEVSEEIIWSTLGGGRLRASKHWASQKLFDYALRAHRLNGRFTPVLFPDRDAPDIMHWTCPLPLHARGQANVYTFHDLIPLKLPHTTNEQKAAYLSMCREIVDRADHILTVSETTRNDLVTMLSAPDDKITTTYQSVSIPSEILSMPEIEAERYVADVFDLNWKGYFLFYGAIEPKKNVNRLVEAYLSSGVRTPLVIVGGRSWLDGGEGSLIASVIESDNDLRRGRIIKHDFLSAAMLNTLIRGARATLFPSLYEGFGLPVLESMLLGTAVLTSTAGSLPEVAGEAALMVDPYDTDTIKAGIVKLDADTDLVNHLERSGQQQASKFSPAAHRQRIAEAYAKL